MMLTLIVSLFAVAGFGFGLWATKIAATARDAVDKTMAGVSAMLDPELDDTAKEVAVRHAGLGLIAAAFQIFLRFALTLALAAMPIYAADAIGLAARDAVLSLMLRLDYIAAVSIAAIVVVGLLRRRRARPYLADGTTNRYSTTDRFFHNVAFASPSVLRGVSWVEDRLVRTPAQTETRAPIFVTSLARGGTTALLNALYDLPGVATHIYRDMPFLTAPILWNRLAGGGRRSVERHERAHGDGMVIDLDSPEAFEEVLWKMFWAEKYRGPSIDLWHPDDRNPDAERFMTRHMSKVVRARHSENSSERVSVGVYCSKNNANIARIPYLIEAFPDCRILVPVRRPEAHAASLLRQHQNFLQQQDEDPFTRRYMGDIGHYEFGRIHKPIAFPGFDPTRYDAATSNYWLDYWTHAFRHILRNRDRCIFILQDDLRHRPEETMSAICEHTDLSRGDLGFTSYFRSGRDQSDPGAFDRQLFKSAEDIYQEIAASSIMKTRRTA